MNFARSVCEETSDTDQRTIRSPRVHGIVFLILIHLPLGGRGASG